MATNRKRRMRGMKTCGSSRSSQQARNNPFIGPTYNPTYDLCLELYTNLYDNVMAFHKSKRDEYNHHNHYQMLEDYAYQVLCNKINPSLFESLNKHFYAVIEFQRHRKRIQDNYPHLMFLAKSYGYDELETHYDVID